MRFSCGFLWVHEQSTECGGRVHGVKVQECGTE